MTSSLVNSNERLSALGAVPTAEGVCYRVWAPKAARVWVEVRRGGGESRRVPLDHREGGYHQGRDYEGSAGDRYRYALEGHGCFCDPLSRAQDGGVKGWSVVVDARDFSWTDSGFRCPAFRDLVMYELHIGTFSPEGTFRAAIRYLDRLAEIGINAIEIMPIADFPGDRNWGYDGVLLYAPAECYGPPEDLRALVDAAHARGLAVILDVVYNHFGPDGNPLPSFSDFYFSKKHHTPWGAALNFDDEHSGPVREFFRGNAPYWMEEFHIDGFRLDAIHAIIDDSPRHILSEITEAIHARGGFVVAEDERNDAKLITPVSEGGAGFDAVWADDFHHSTRVAITGEQAAYFANFGGTPEEIAATLNQGWYYSGAIQKIPPKARGTNGAHLPPERFIHCISNHDQVGNRALGERINHLVAPEAYRALSALLCLSPYTPLLFMGQEWGASTPFLFFTDHEGELGRKITEGRRKEFGGFSEYDEPAEQSTIPDPQARQTFERSILKWDERWEANHNPLLLLYAQALALRAKYPALRPAGRDTWTCEVLEWGAVIIRLGSESEELCLAFDLKGGRKGRLPAPRRKDAVWELVFSSDEERFGGGNRTAASEEGLAFRGAALVLLRASSGGPDSDEAEVYVPGMTSNLKQPIPPR